MAKILIVDDEQDIRDLVNLTLSFGGDQVITAANGEEAYQKVISETPDLILLDVRMPRESGYETCKRLQANKATKNIPIVFLSAKGQESEVKAGLEAGAVDYIIKPFSLEELAHRIHKILLDSKKS